MAIRKDRERVGRPVVRAWTASGRIMVLSSLVLCALRSLAWCAPGRWGEEKVVEILSPMEGKMIRSCADRGRVRVPVRFHQSIAP